MNFSLVALNSRYSHSCLALFYVRNELEKNLVDCRTTITQLTINDPYFETLLKLSSSTSNYLLFSVYIWNSDYVKRLVVDLLSASPHLKIVLGGPQAPAINDLPGNCTIVEGEIEGVSKSFYDDLSDGKLKNSYKSKPGNHFSSPYRKNDFNSYLNNRNIYYESSRGCPFSCAYCLSSTSHGIVNTDIDQTIEELKNILVHQPKLIKFVDRTFNADPQRTLAIWRFLADQNCSTMFHFEIAPDLFTPEMFQFLGTIPPGKFQFEIGIQSTNPETLNAVNRKMDLELAKKNIDCLMAKNNIHLHLDLILGLPAETKDTFRKSINDIFSLKPHYIQMGLLKVLPNTKISENALPYGLTYCQKPPYQVLATTWINHHTLSELYWLGECIEAFYNNRYFRNFFNYLHTIEPDYYSFFENLLKQSRHQDLFELAKTQKLLNSILTEAIRSHQEEKLLNELLIFDWLSCGHRFLPENVANSNLTSVRDYLWHNLPENYPRLYDHQSKNDFFKRGTFIKLSKRALRAIKMLPEGDRGNYICFLPDQKEGIFQHNKAVMLTLPGQKCRS